MTFTVAPSLRSDAESAARQMLAAGDLLAPILTPDGTAMFHVTTDESKLGGALLEFELEGKTIYAGMLA